jgi:hypothetical protein
MPRIKKMPATLALVLTGLLGFGAWNAATRGRAGAGDAGGISRNPADSTAPLPPSDDPFARALSTVGGKTLPADSLKSLSELRASLAALPTDEAVARIRGFLEGGDDRPTGLSFEIGDDGSLSEWPSFRTFLLDALLAIDPAAAAAIGRDILATPTTADEWVLALRNLARTEGATADFLRGKTEELIANPGWQANPSIGYLNAFDVLVHVEATESTPLLSGLIQRKDRKDLAHAGFLTLDRLVQRQPADVLARLAADRDLHASRPEMVAQQFARADLRDPAQQAVVKQWMLDPARSPTELRSFAGVYPNNNHFVSNNLLTTESATSGGDLARHDREALDLINTWAADPAFEPIGDYLRTMIARLDGFVDLRESAPLPSSPE